MRTSIPSWPGRAAAGWLLAVLALLAVVLVAFASGKFPIAPGQLGHALWSGLTGADSGLPVSMETVIWRIRLPRVGAALLVGAALSAAGAAYQGMFRNPLVSPDILGVSAGAGLGAVVGIYVGLPLGGVQGLAFAGGLLAVLLVLGIAALVRRHDPVAGGAWRRPGQCHARVVRGGCGI